MFDLTVSTNQRTNRIPIRGSIKGIIKMIELFLDNANSARLLIVIIF